MQNFSNPADKAELSQSITATFAKSLGLPSSAIKIVGEQPAASPVQAGKVSLGAVGGARVAESTLETEDLDTALTEVDVTLTDLATEGEMELSDSGGVSVT